MGKHVLYLNIYMIFIIILSSWWWTLVLLCRWNAIRSADRMYLNGGMSLWVYWNINSHGSKQSFSMSSIYTKFWANDKFTLLELHVFVVSICTFFLQWTNPRFLLMVFEIIRLAWTYICVWSWRCEVVQSIKGAKVTQICETQVHMRWKLQLSEARTLL